MTNMIAHEAGIESYHVTPVNSDRMKQITRRVFDMCQDLVDVGLMEQTELAQIVDQSQRDPGFALDYLHQYDDAEV